MAEGQMFVTVFCCRNVSDLFSHLRVFVNSASI